MENWKAIRHDVLVHGLSQRAACEKYQLGWHTLKKILAHTGPRDLAEADAALHPTGVGQTLLAARSG